jgi:hypothetical protein
VHLHERFEFLKPVTLNTTVCNVTSSMVNVCRRFGGTQYLNIVLSMKDVHFKIKSAKFAPTGRRLESRKLKARIGLLNSTERT